jgi:hypothetical protein
MANNMALEHILQLVAKQSKVNGKRVKDFIGFKTLKNDIINH